VLRKELLTFSQQRNNYWVMENRIGFSFLLPTLLLFAFVFIFPICFVLFASLLDWNMMKPMAGVRFVGIENYISLLTDKSIWHSIWVTAKFVIVAVPLEMVLGVCLALLMDREFKGKRIIQALILIPCMVSPTSSYLSWKFLFEPTYGLLNYLLGLLHLKEIGWLSDVKTALMSIVIVDMWQNIPFVYLVAYAGLQAISEEPVEAAQVDGASGLQILWHVILPELKPVLLVTAIVRLMDAIRVFDNIYVLTRGGPADATRTLQYECYDTAFQALLVGRGSALAIIIVVIILMVGWPLIKQMNEITEERR